MFDRIGSWRPSLFHIQLGALAFLSLLLMTVSFNAWEAGRARLAAESLYAHTLDVLLQTSRMREGVGAEVRGERGYLLTHDRAFLGPYFEGRDAVRVTTDTLAKLTRDNPVQIANIARLRQELRNYEDMIARTVSLEQAGRHDQAVALVRVGRGQHYVDRVLTAIKRMDQEEKRLLKLRQARLEGAMRGTDRSQYLLSIVGFLLVVLSGWSALSVDRLQARMVELNAELEALATSDALTGLPNRRAFFDALESDQGRRRPSAIAILDVDHFKRVNDAHGHPVGDRLLRAVAAVLRQTVRTSDTVSRIGGEEFAILMPGTTVHQAMQACERLRAAVEAHVLLLGSSGQVRVSISVGVAARAPVETPESWIGKADKALYRAKKAGRNRVLLAA